METMFQWLGLAVAWVVVILIAWGLFNWAVEAVTNLYDRMVSSAKLHARHDLGHEIAVQAHWFSESKEVETVLRVLGEWLVKYPDYRYDAEHVREEWRRKLDQK